jgi:hypothetical protein
MQRSSRVIFKPDGSKDGPSDDDASSNGPSSDTIFIDGAQCNTSTADTTIPKPSGQVTRLKRDGYNLQDKLKWKADFYYEVQVRIILLLTQIIDSDTETELPAWIGIDSSQPKLDIHKTKLGESEKGV